MKPHRLLPAADCPHLTLDTRTVPATCRQCGTPWAELTAETHRTRLAQHAAGERCDACGTDHYPHGDAQ